MNFSLILAMEFPKKKIMEVPRIENLKRQKFSAYCLFHNTLLFVRNKQASENRSAEAAIKIGVLRGKK